MIRRAGLAVASLVVLGLASAAETPRAAAADADSAAAAGGKASASGPRRPAWREWSREAFDEARASRRLVLLNLTAGWCHWCRVMEDSSYTDGHVLGALNLSYVPIRVDTDLRPDISDRYLGNGWPTTAVLTPEGHLLAAATYLPPSGLRDFLTQASRFYKTNRAQVDPKVAEAERGVARTWDPDTLVVSSLTEEEYIEQNLDALFDLEDKENGGFGSAPKTARWDAISFLLRAADARADDRLRALAVRGAAAALALQDSVDGGFFRAALSPDWSRPRYERLLDEQARAIATLSRVYRATGEARFRDAAARADSFLTKLSTRNVSGPPRPPLRAWIGPDARQPDGSWVNGDVYFGLSRTARARLGPPPVSDFVVADATARVVSSDLIRARCTEGPAWNRLVVLGATVSESLDLLEVHLRSDDDRLAHANDGERTHAPGLLADQVAVGLSRLDAYEFSGLPSDLAKAEQSAAWLRANLEDPTGGGFRYAPRDTAAVGRLRAGEKPELANVEAGTFFLRIYWLTGNEEYRRIAQRTADYLRSGPKITLDPARAELVLRLRSEPVRLAVVGKGPAAMNLRAAALLAPAPEVVVRSIEAPPAEFEGLSWPFGLPRDAKSPAVYRWTVTGWRGPVTDAAKIADLFDLPRPSE
ncbi:MAG TPA: DUF255 domain-containing protein [Candidatus Eisenbacteria bacterium]|nr:DUF255 domain-containing protein [Candidatus Eisenbacteria bacterium]